MTFLCEGDSWLNEAVKVAQSIRGSRHSDSEIQGSLYYFRATISSFQDSKNYTPGCLFPIHPLRPRAINGHRVMRRSVYWSSFLLYFRITFYNSRDTLIWLFPLLIPILMPKLRVCQVKVSSDSLPANPIPVLPISQFKICIPYCMEVTAWNHCL